MEKELVRYFSNESTTEEMEAIERWRNESDVNAKEFLEAKESYLLSGPREAPADEHLRAVWSRIESEGSDEAEHSSIQRKLNPTWWRVAAALAILAVLGWVMVQYVLRPSGPDAYVFGTNTVQELPDGTMVTLSSGAVLKVMDDFNESERLIELSGKAHFDVTSNPEKPFRIVNALTEVVVLGTSFVVRNEPSESIIEVEEGEVAVKKRSASLEVRLQAGEMALVSSTKEGLAKRKIQSTNAMSWKTGLMTFEGTKMSQVAATLGDVYNVDIRVPAGSEDCRLSAKFKQKTLQEVIEIISLTYNWSYDIKEYQVVLSGNGC